MKTWYIEKANLLQKLSEEETRLLKAEGTVLTLSKGEQVFPALEKGPSCVYVVLSGYAKLLTMNMEGKRFSISILQGGDFLGTILSLNTGISPAETSEEFLELMTEAHILRIDSQRFETVMNNNPTLYISILQILQGKSRQIQRKLTSLLFKDVYARIAQLFLELTFTHGEECPYAFGLHRDLCLKHHEIAELIGASRPVTSMALGKFAKTDLIHKHNGFICLNNMEGLRQVAESGALAIEQLETVLSKHSVSC